MPVEQKENARNGLDRKQFDEILQRFNADTAEEVDAAVVDALRFCDRRRLPFRDVVCLAYGQDDRATEFQRQLAAARQENANAKEERGKFVQALDELRTRCTALRGENDRLQQGARYCRGCENLRRALAVIGGLTLGSGWFLHVPFHGLKPWPLALGGTALAAIPFLCTVGRWYWLLFSRKVRWRSVRDNEVVRWWKELR
jgi:hypothetical protein